MLKVRHWTIHPAHLRAFGNFYGSIWGCPNSPKMTKYSIKKLFLVVLDRFAYNNLVWGLFSSLDIEPYILPTCDLCVLFWVHWHLGVPK
jgi:hypothetical protein